MSDVGLMGMHVPGMSWREMREAAVLAEELGYSCITMGESWGEDALTSLAQLAAVTSRIRIGTSIVPVFARSPANLAMTALNLDRMSGGHEGLSKTAVPNLASFYLAAPKAGEFSTILGNAAAPEDAKVFMGHAQRFLTAVLRKDSGAAVPMTEYAPYWIQFIPMPGDTSKVLEQKTIARQTAMDSIKNNLPADAILRKAQEATGPTGSLPPGARKLQLRQSDGNVIPGYELGGSYFKGDGTPVKKRGN